MVLATPLSSSCTPGGWLGRALGLTLVGWAIAVGSPARALTLQSINPVALPDPFSDLNPSAPAYTEANSTDATYGYWFSVSQPITVNALGIFSSSGILSTSHSVGLWEFFSTDLLASASFEATDGRVCPLYKDSFCWAEITPLDLSPGDYQVAATGGWENDSIALYGNVTVLNPAVTWIASSYSDVTDPIGDAYPYFPFPYPIDNPLGDEATVPVWGGNLSVTSEAPPAASVPGPLPLAGAAAAYGWSRRLRRRISG